MLTRANEILKTLEKKVKIKEKQEEKDMTIYSATAHAIASPSYVDVPLPISSNITKLFLVAFFIIFDTSDISTINVLCPILKSSDAPTLVNILSTTPILADDAGTKLPICAINGISATCTNRKNSKII